MSTTLIDLSHVIEDGMVTYKGLPAPIICDYLSRENSKQFYEPGTEFQIGKIEMISNTGTYVDCPFHRYPDGDDLSQVDLKRFANLDGVLINAPFKSGINIDPKNFEAVNVKGKAVLVNTGWSTHWRTDAYFENHPFLTEEAAIYLRDQGAVLVGIDSHNIDDTRTRKRPVHSRPVHSTLLKTGILIVEHMCNLGKLPSKGFRFNAVPPKFKGVGTFPVRAYAELQG
jgi:arylformamidase